MRLIATSRAPDGAELGRDVLVGRPDGAPLLRSGVILTDRYRELLMRAGVRAIYIEDRASAGIVVEPMVDDVTREVATRAVSSAYTSARDSLTKGKSLAPGVVDSLEDVVDRLIRHVDTSEGVALALADLSSADAYTYQHSIDVAALGILIGQRYFRQHGWIDYRGERNFTRIDERLSSLGLGLLLHDIGKLSIPSSILDKPGTLTPEEWKIMQTHPRAGVDLLESGNWSPLVKAVVLRHHERWDGSGYPGGEVGEEIHQMARIAAVADVYDAITSDRRYAPARPAHDGVRAICEGSGALFDPDVVDAFKGLVAPFPPGSPIELTDDRRGVVVSVDEHTLDRPVVRVLEGDGAPYEVSLLLDSSIKIAGWDDVETAAETAEQPLAPAGL